MKITYLILAHEYFNQLDIMIVALNADDVDFIIHIDRRHQINSFKNFKFFNHPKVKIIRNRYEINWGGFSMVDATLALIRERVKRNSKGYLILMSGLDYPIKTPGYIRDFLAEKSGMQFIRHFPIPFSEWKSTAGGFDRIRYFWFVDRIGLRNSSIFFKFQQANNMVRPFFEDLPLYGGSQWWCITDDCAEYILSFLKYNPLYKKYFEDTLIPDEVFFQTILVNSEYRERLFNSNLKYIDWKTGPGSPRILEESDLQNLINSDALWARKFNPSASSDLLKKIDETILNQSYLIFNKG